MKKVTLSVACALYCSFMPGPAAAITRPADTMAMQQYPMQPDDIHPLLIGEHIPTATLPGTDGIMVDLNNRITQQPTILIIYRGGWCPFCSKELGAVQELQPYLTGLGYQIIAISTDSPEKLDKSRDKQHLVYTLLSDADLDFSKRFGLAYKAPAAYDKILQEGSGGKNTDKLIPVPSVFILDQKGVIRFEYVNPDYTQRIHPGLLKAAAVSVKEDLAAQK